MSMEMTFIITGLCVLGAGTVLGFVTYWAFEHDNKEETK